MTMGGRGTVGQAVKVCACVCTFVHGVFVCVCACACVCVCDRGLPATTSST